MLNKQSILIRISPTPLNIKELPAPGQSQRCCGRDGFWEERASAHLQLSYKLQAVGGLGTGNMFLHSGRDLMGIHVP